MGGPSIGFCAGRIDVIDNKQMLPLGPTPEQEKFAACPVNGQCPFPLGQNTIGLIYVNPEGPMGLPDPKGAADTVRDVFGRMDWHGRELVALIGGGHTFGKAHGASMASTGEIPAACPFAPWSGPKGIEAITSGFEGPWTSEPTKWDNKYFQYLVDFQWEPVQSPAGKWQWRVKDGDGPRAPVADPSLNDTQDVMMLTTDVALIMDPEYRTYVEEFAKNLSAFEHEFAHAWYKLVTRDMGPHSRCVGPRVPSARQFQHPLPEPSKHLADMKSVSEDIREIIERNPKGEFIRLAWQCASTYRATDYQGGCNGARIRFPPGSEWKINDGLGDTLALLEPVKKKYGKGLSYADLIVLAGNVELEMKHPILPALPFCPGRTDAEDGSGWNQVEYGNTDFPKSVDEAMELAQRRGQTSQDISALSFVAYGSAKKLRKMLKSNHTDDLLADGLRYYPELRYWADYYAAAGDEQYAKAFVNSWTKLMNADRFDGPVRNICGENI